jgi:hypothetical protein
MDMTEDDAGIYVTTTAAKTGKNISEGSRKEGEKGNDEVKRILELQFRVRQMERELKEKDAKLRPVATIQQERIEMLEKNVLGKFKAIDPGRRAAKTKSEGGSTRKKKGLKAVNQLQTRSVKPMITWVDLEDEADAVLDMELEDESQNTKSALEDIKSL